jgi:hypothetical protein
LRHRNVERASVDRRRQISSVVTKVKAGPRSKTVAWQCTRISACSNFERWRDATSVSRCSTWRATPSPPPSASASGPEHGAHAGTARSFHMWAPAASGAVSVDRQRATKPTMWRLSVALSRSGWTLPPVPVSVGLGSESAALLESRREQLLPVCFTHPGRRL